MPPKKKGVNVKDFFKKPTKKTTKKKAKGVDVREFFKKPTKKKKEFDVREFFKTPARKTVPRPTLKNVGISTKRAREKEQMRVGMRYGGGINPPIGARYLGNPDTTDDQILYTPRTEEDIRINYDGFDTHRRYRGEFDQGSGYTPTPIPKEVSKFVGEVIFILLWICPRKVLR